LSFYFVGRKARFSFSFFFFFCLFLFLSFLLKFSFLLLFVPFGFAFVPLFLWFVLKRSLSLFWLCSLLGFCWVKKTNIIHNQQRGTSKHTEQKKTRSKPKFICDGCCWIVLLNCFFFFEGCVLCGVICSKRKIGGVGTLFVCLFFLGDFLFPLVVLCSLFPFVFQRLIFSQVLV